MTKDLSLQQKYSPDGICFGCGPSNDKGLHINSFPDGDEVVAEWHAEPHHQAFPGMLNGGIIGALARLPLKLDGGLFFDETRQQG